MKQIHAIDLNRIVAPSSRRNQKPEPMPFAERFKAAHEKLGLTQEQAAKKWGVNVRTLQDWEQKRHEPRGFGRVQLEKLLDGILGPAPASRKRRSS